MSDPRRRLVLEEIAFGLDSSPADRLRALDLLDRIEPPDHLRAELETADEGALDDLLDRSTATTIALLAGENPETIVRYPQTHGVLEREIERRAAERSQRPPSRPISLPTGGSLSAATDEPEQLPEPEPELTLPAGWQLERGWRAR